MAIGCLVIQFRIKPFFRMFLTLPRHSADLFPKKISIFNYGECLPNREIKIINGQNDDGSWRGAKYYVNSLTRYTAPGRSSFH